MENGRNEINIPHNCTSECFEMDSPSDSQLACYLLSDQLSEEPSPGCQPLQLETTKSILKFPFHSSNYGNLNHSSNTNTSYPSY